MSQFKEPERDHHDVWQRAAGQASADIQRTRSREEARASFLEKLANRRRRNGTVTTKELGTVAKVAAASRK